MSKFCWLIRTGELKKSDFEKNGGVNGGGICTGVSVYELNSDLNRNNKNEKDKFVQEVVDSIPVTLTWKEAHLAQRKNFNKFSLKIPKPFQKMAKFKKGFINTPPKNHYELWGFHIKDVLSIFKSARIEVKNPN